MKLTNINGAIVGLLCLLLSQTVTAETYTLGIAPVLSSDKTRETYQPLADYLSQQTGHTIKLRPSINFLSYWHEQRKPDHFDLVLDGAHLADYRMHRLNHQLVAKVVGVLSFTLISNEDDLILETDELVTQPVAVQASPNLGGVLVYNLFPKPAQQPVIVEVNNAVEALDAVRSKKARAAFVPTPILARYPEATVIKTSEQMPNMTMTASPRVPTEVVDALRKALIGAASTEEGKLMLTGINATGFERADPGQYGKLHRLLENMWGY